jgi:predicted PurR-regulated permease PerM
VINLNLSTATRIGLNLLALLGVVVALRLGESIFIPTVIAILLSAILWPMAKSLQFRFRMPWFLSCFAVLGIVLTVLAVVFVCFFLAVPKLIQDLPSPNNEDSQRAFYLKLRGQVEKLSPEPLEGDLLAADPDRSRLFDYMKKTFNGTYMTDMLFKLLSLSSSLLFQAVLIMFILLFLLLEGEMLSRRVVEIFGPGGDPQRQAVEALAEMAKSIRSYLVWRTIVNFGLGLFLGLVYQLSGLHQPWTWALLTAILCYVPYIGTIMAGIPPVLDAFLNCDSPWVSFGILFFYIAVVTFEGYIIVPVVMGSSMELNATTVLLSCLFWELVWGTPGLFLAMPIMAGVKAVCLHVPGWEAWGNLMGTRVSHPPPSDPDTAKRIEEIAEHLQSTDATLLMEPPATDDDRR